MIDKSLEAAYQNLLKENTRLHAEKKLIVDSAEKAIRNADSEIQKLHDVIHQIVPSAIRIVEASFPKSSERAEAVDLISRLTPLQVMSDGQEKKR